MADPRLLIPNLPANRLRCPDCKAFRSITDFPFQSTGFRRLSCIHCKIRRANRRQRIQTQKTQESSKEQVLADPPIIFCSSCNQQRPNTQFGHFFTCNFCRSTNTKSLRRRRQTQPQYHTPSLQQIKNHLQKWVALYGEYELKLQHRQQRYMCNSVLFCDLRRPLTVEDYLEGSPNKQGS